MVQISWWSTYIPKAYCISYSAHNTEKDNGNRFPRNHSLKILDGMDGYKRWLIQPLPSFPIPTYIMGDLQETWRAKVTFPYVKDGHLGLDQLGLDPGLPEILWSVY